MLMGFLHWALCAGVCTRPLHDGAEVKGTGERSWDLLNLMHVLLGTDANTKENDREGPMGDYS